VTRHFLQKALGRNSPLIAGFDALGISIGITALTTRGTNRTGDDPVSTRLQNQTKRLEAFVDVLQRESQLGSEAPVKALGSANGRRVFLVHGRTEGALHEAARFLERLGLKVIILREQPGQGRTIIEKFETYADVGFAVVLLTADDRGGLVDVPYKDQQPRARQNVILELGYFIGRLGRERVCALCEAGVEIPSDYAGVQYVPLDAVGRWRFELAIELRTAGMSVDMNKLAPLS
jgi:predicted nucleotide-binding protein